MAAPCWCLIGHVKEPFVISMALGARPLVKLLHSACASLCRNIFNHYHRSDVKMKYFLTSKIFNKTAFSLYSSLRYFEMGSLPKVRHRFRLLFFQTKTEGCLKLKRSVDIVLVLSCLSVLVLSCLSVCCQL